MLTVKEVKDLLKGVAEAASDAAKHIKEDELFHRVMLAIADDAKNAQALALAALESKKLKFNRHVGD